MRPSFVHLAALLALTALLPTGAQALSPAYPLRNGQYIWENAAVPVAASTAGALSITISLTEQRLYVYRAGQLIGISTASTGRRGHLTPLGDFTILQKRQWHRSNIYSNAPMPFMQRLTWGGIALHAGHLPGYPASHGCIRLPYAFAQRLFGITTLGVPVTIVSGNRREPVVRLRFADLEWMAGDEVLSIPVEPARAAAPARRPAPVPAVARTVEGVRQPEARNPAVPHWAAPADIDAVRHGRPPRLQFEMLPE